MVTKAKDHSEFHYWCPRVQKDKEWKSSHWRNRSYQLTHAGLPAIQGQIGRHLLAGNSFFCVGGFLFLVFLNPWASILKFWMVFCIGNHFLFKSIWWGVYIKHLQTSNSKSWLLSAVWFHVEQGLSNVSFGSNVTLASFLSLEPLEVFNSISLDENWRFFLKVLNMTMIINKINKSNVLWSKYISKDDFFLI